MWTQMSRSWFVSCPTTRKIAMMPSRSSAALLAQVSWETWFSTVLNLKQVKNKLSSVNYCFNGHFYSMICLICFTVPSQMVVSRTLNKAKQLMSVATKIAIQMNCKMGGVVWAVPIPVSIAVAILIEQWKMGCRTRTLFCFGLSVLFWCPVLGTLLNCIETEHCKCHDWKSVV